MSGPAGADLALFHVLNGEWHQPLLDVVLPIFTRSSFLAVAGLLVAGLLVWRGGAGRRRALVAVVVALALSDFISGQILKPAFHRPRPCRSVADVRLLVHCGGRNGLPSNHAANAAAVAAVLACLVGSRSLRWTAPLALAIGWSRVYVGVHFPGDVLAGYLAGGSIGTGVGLAFLRAWRRAPEPGESGPESPGRLAT